MRYTVSFGFRLQQSQLALCVALDGGSAAANERALAKYLPTADDAGYSPALQVELHTQWDQLSLSVWDRRRGVPLVEPASYQMSGELMQHLLVQRDELSEAYVVFGQPGRDRWASGVRCRARWVSAPVH